MRNVEIECFPIARTGLDRSEIRKWLDRCGATSYEPPYDGITETEGIIGLAAKRCYMSFEPGLNPNITKVRKDWAVYLDNVLKSGHGSVLEHASWTWAIEGVSRVFTGEMNRHRAGVAISEGSMRYIRFTDIPWWMPTSIREQEKDSDDLKNKKCLTRQIFNQAFQQMEQNYTQLVEIWELDGMVCPACKGKGKIYVDAYGNEKNACSDCKGKGKIDKDFAEKKQITSCLRRIIGMGVATGGVWTLNVRALRHIMTMRAEAAAEEEIFLVASTIAKTMVEEEVKLFGDFTQDEHGYWAPKYRKV